MVLTRYSISELAKVLDISRTAVLKKIKKFGYETVSDEINGRNITLVPLTESQVNVLKNDVKKYKGFTQGVTLDLTSATGKESVSVNEAGMDVLKQVLKQFDTYNTQLQTYVNRLIESESKVKLLEDSEQRRENEYLSQIAELKTKLAKYESKKYWQFWK